MYAYRFAGSWRDVGTIDSLWEANMEVLDPENSGIDIFDKTWQLSLIHICSTALSRASPLPCRP